MANVNVLSERNKAIAQMQRLNTEYRGVTPLKFYEPLNLTLANIFSAREKEDVLNIAVAPVHRLGSLADVRIYGVDIQGGYKSTLRGKLPEALNLQNVEDVANNTTITIRAFIIPGKTAITSTSELDAWVTANTYIADEANKRTFFGFPIKEGLVKTTIGEAVFVKYQKNETQSLIFPVEIPVAGMSLALCRERLQNINWETDINGDGHELVPMDDMDKGLNGAGVLCLQISSDGDIHAGRAPAGYAQIQMIAEYTMYETHSGSLANSLPGMYATHAY